MKKGIILVILFTFLLIPAHAQDFTAPPAPDDAQELMPYEETDFLDGLVHVIMKALEFVTPSFYEALSLCAKALVVVLCHSMVRCIADTTNGAVSLCATVILGWLLLRSSDAFIQSAAETVRHLSAYGKLLLPVMAASLAAQGGGGAAAALYGGTAIFDAILSSTIEKLLVPLVYAYLALALLASATGNEALIRMKKSLHRLTTKGLRIALYIFTGYLTVTGVVGGSADQMQLKAAKLTISGMVPVVGNIMADASETILISAGLVKSAVGIYGLLAIVATVLVPALTIGIRYLLLKATAAAADLFGGKTEAGLIADFGSAMSLLLAMTLSQTLLILVSTVCFMKGMG